MNTLDAYNPSRVDEELQTKGTLKCLSKTRGPAGAEVTPCLTLPVELLIEIITCPGETRGPSGYCGPARLSERVAALLRTSSHFHKCYKLEGPLHDADGLIFYRLWHLAEYEDTQRRRKERAEQWEAERNKNVALAQMQNAAISRILEVMEKMQGRGVPSRKQATDFFRLLIETGDPGSAAMLKCYGYDPSTITSK